MTHLSSPPLDNQIPFGGDSTVVPMTTFPSVTSMAHLKQAKFGDLSAEAVQVVPTTTFPSVTSMAQLKQAKFGELR